MDWRRTPGDPWRRLAYFGGLLLLVAAVGVTAALVLLPVLTRGFVRALELMIDACMWLAMSMSAGISVWSLLSTVGRTMAGALATWQASVVLILLVLVSGVAFYGLQRVLGSEEESSR